MDFLRSPWPNQPFWLKMACLLVIQNEIQAVCLAFTQVAVVSIAKVDLEKTKMQKNDLSVSPLLHKPEE